MFEGDRHLTRRKVKGPERRDLWWDAANRPGSLGSRQTSQEQPSAPQVADVTDVSSVVPAILEAPGLFLHRGNIAGILNTAEEIALERAAALEGSGVPAPTVDDTLSDGINFLAGVEHQIGTGELRPAIHSVISALKSSPNPGAVVERVLFKTAERQLRPST